MIKKNVRLLVILKIILVIIAISLLIISIYFLNSNKIDNKTVEAVRAEYKITTDTKAYIILNETIIDLDKNLSFVPLAISKERITKNGVIGIYKDENYDNNLVKLNNMDDNIKEKLAKVESVYSTDITTIENKIEESIKEFKTKGSVIEFSNYKNKLDDFVYDKALTKSKLTPSGSEITKLIEERDLFYDSMNNTSKNVKSNVSGVVVYENDGIENLYSMDTLSNNIDNIEDMIKEYSKIKSNNFGVKIVDNYKSYLIIKDNKENDKYAKIGLYYDIELIDLNKIIRVKLLNKISNENVNYYIFESTNGIENYVDLRSMNISINFKTLNAFPISNEAIYYKNEIAYVKIFSLNEYIEIPVKILLNLNNISYVDNYTKTEKQEKNILETRKLLQYDRIVNKPLF